MKFKLDENLGSQTARLFAAQGHDVQTVPQERLAGTGDQHLFDVCVAEGRCLVTLDLDFADALRFRPEASAGIAVLRLPRAISLNLVNELARNLLAGLDREPIAGRLWIVEAGRIRVHGEAAE